MLDDGLVAVSGTFEHACKARDEMLADLERLGVQVNWKKSVLCAARGSCQIEGNCQRYGGKRGCIIARVGEWGRQSDVYASGCAGRQCYGLIRPGGDWDRTGRLTEAVLHELLQVVDWVSHFNRFGNPIRRYVGMDEVIVTLDAGSIYGWRIEGRVRSLRFNSPALATAADWKPGEKREWQPWNELLAVEKCLIGEAGRLAGITVLIRPDATTPIRYVNKRSGPSKMLTAIIYYEANLDYLSETWHLFA